jgi:hypothetical protein
VPTSALAASSLIEPLHCYTGSRALPYDSLPIIIFNDINSNQTHRIFRNACPAPAHSLSLRWSAAFFVMYRSTPNIPTGCSYCFDMYIRYSFELSLLVIAKLFVLDRLYAARSRFSSTSRVTRSSCCNSFPNHCDPTSCGG